MKPAKILGLLVFFLVAMTASSARAHGTDAVTVTVTAINHRTGTLPHISKGDVVVRQDGDVRPVLGWEPSTGSRGGVDFAVLIDDSLDQPVALQWKELSSFIRELPADSRVAIAYSDHGSATMAQPFTADRERALKALRLPLGKIEGSSSIYLALADLMNHWPAGRNRRVVLLISDGIDIFYGIRESNPGLNINLQRAIDAAQKKGAVVDSIFASGASAYSRNIYLIANGQSCLARLALETGGTDYQVGNQTPVNFSPFLQKILGSLGRQFLLTFRAKLGSKPNFSRLQLTVEQSGIELLGPSRVYVPAAH
ncbi:MAG: hypothetical protein KGL59_06230 [Acidobacteriota bacterium]|nr:hypothetical protein [Acidobacteriota bacterium]